MGVVPIHMARMAHRVKTGHFNHDQIVSNVGQIGQEERISHLLGIFRRHKLLNKKFHIKQHMHLLILALMDKAFMDLASYSNQKFGFHQVAMTRLPRMTASGIDGSPLGRITYWTSGWTVRWLLTLKL